MSLPLLTGCVAQASAGGGGGEVTDIENLSHWWKMPSPGEASPPTSMIDVATNSTTRQNIAASNITVAAGDRTLGANTFDAYDFNGSSSHSRQLNKATFMADTFSLTCWIKIASITTWDSIYSVGVTNGGWNTGLMLFFTTSAIANGYSSGVEIPANSIVWGSDGYSNSVGAATAYAASPSVGSWAHVAVTLDVSGQTQEIYINGVAGTSPSGTIVTPGVFNSSYYMAVGSLAYHVWYNNFFFDGNMSDFRIYQSCLTSSQVAAIYEGDWAP